MAQLWWGRVKKLVMSSRGKLYAEVGLREQPQTDDLDVALGVWAIVPIGNDVRLGQQVKITLEFVPEDASLKVGTAQEAQRGQAQT